MSDMTGAKLIAMDGTEARGCAVRGCEGLLSTGRNGWAPPKSAHCGLRKDRWFPVCTNMFIVE